MKAYVIGNVAWDETLAVEAWPQPGVSLFASGLTADLGGKGCNQAVVIGRCGVPTVLVAAIGADAAAAAITARLAAEPLTARLVSRPDLPSDRSIILSGPDAENAIVTTVACAEALKPADVETALRDATAGDWVILQGNLRDETTEAALAIARRRGLATAFNPSPMRPAFAAMLALADIVFVNSHEAHDLTGLDGTEAATALRAMGATIAVVTLGAAGSLLATAGSVVAVPAAPAHPVDTTGAGDSFLGTALASAISRGPLDPLALSHGARAAALTIGRRGTVAAFPTATEMSEILASAEAPESR
ncbi:PfkB family carbohydrate kinase [Segnochrobactrum spirostomi]|uniref:Ribokinase n=1 Tax=Segnochrobactrum spirostomi TaxID=2608987 RepID=A0A6A7YB59_9HYPH|nr:PfkB family carbohydrate kinase [Segnochrobactrum spirostomi]MQT15537.1 ribokinase [Segnochrobactrum spirostomi]